MVVDPSLLAANLRGGFCGMTRLLGLMTWNRIRP